MDSGLINRCMSACGWSEEFAKKVYDNYIIFLKIKADVCDIYHDFFAPSTVIDKMWQQHILDTRSYALTCKDLLGNSDHIMHRDPCEFFENNIYKHNKLYTSMIDKLEKNRSVNIWPNPTCYIMLINHNLSNEIQIPHDNFKIQIAELMCDIAQEYDINLNKNIIMFKDMHPNVKAFEMYEWSVVPIPNKKRQRKVCFSVLYNDIKYTLTCDRTETVLDLKHILCKKTGVCCSNQSIFHLNEEYKNDKLIDEYENGKILHLYKK